MPLSVRGGRERRKRSPAAAAAEGAAEGALLARAASCLTAFALRRRSSCVGRGSARRACTQSTLSPH